MFPHNGVTTIDVRTKNAAGDTPLHLAALWGDEEAVGQLLQAGAYVDEPGAGGRTALYYAILEGHLGVAERLIAAGADPDREADVGISPRDIAAQRRDDRVTRLLSTQTTRT
jgi:ankyrin repeat protein